VLAFTIIRYPELRKKLLFTLMLVTLFLFGLNLPLPGVNHAVLRQTSGLTDPVATLSGGGLPKLSVFALGIYPYLFAKFVTWCLVLVVPRLRSMARAGGRDLERVLQYIRVFGAGLAVLEATAVVAYAATVRVGAPHGQRVLAVHGFPPAAAMVACLTAGAVTVMWLAELVDRLGFGDGATILLAAPVAAVLPGEFWGISKSKGFGVFALALAVVLATVLFKGYFDLARRKLPVSSMRIPARRGHGLQYAAALPFKLSQQDTAISAAVVVLFVPVLAARLWPGIAWLQDIQPHLHHPSDPWYLATFLVLIVVFTIVEARFVLLNPTELADRLVRSSAFIQGLRPGKPTKQYLTYVLNRITPVRAFYLVILALIPIFGFAMLGADAAFPSGGEAVVLILTVSLDTVIDMDDQAQAAAAGNYTGFLQ
jgi:preprotein translocase subunit SecY